MTDHTDLTRRSAIAIAAAAGVAGRAAGAADAPYVVLITGTSRGLGFEFAKQYAEMGWTVIATARNPQTSEQLVALAKAHKNVALEKLDVTDHASIDALAAKLKDTPIDLLINNAGIGGGGENQVFGKINYTVFDDVMCTNVEGPLKVSEAFVGNVAASRLKKIMMVSSSQGSIAIVNRPSLYWYRSSKAALNMVTANLALELRPRGITVGLVAPGATDTDFMAEVRGRIPLGKPSDRAAGMMKMIESYPKDKTTLIEWNGEVMPW